MKEHGVVEVKYSLHDKERIFDIGQSVHINRRLIVKRSGGKISLYTQMIRKMKRQAILFFVLALIQALLLWAGEVSTGKLVLLVGCVALGAFMLSVWRTQRKVYGQTLALYRENNGAGGRIVFDEAGMTESGDGGEETQIRWEEYEACVVAGEAIVILSSRPVLLIFSRTEQTEQEIRGALAAFGKNESIYCVEVKEKRR